MSSPKRSSDDDEYGRYSESSSVEGSPTKRRRQRVLWNDGEVECVPFFFLRFLPHPPPCKTHAHCAHPVGLSRKVLDDMARGRGQ